MTSIKGLMLVMLAAGATLLACRIHTEGFGSGPPPPPTGGGAPGPGGASGSAGGASYGASVEVITDDSGRQYQVQQGVRGEPGVVGCADGQREAFVDAAAFPRIAGCLAAWPGAKSLRDKSASAPSCGDDAGECPAPGDACAVGWHVCGANGATSDLKQVSAAQCENAGGGRFSAAISHCIAQDGCQYDPAPAASYPCFASGWCSEPVCCGNDCGDFGACRDGVWPGATHIPVGTDQGCSQATSARAGGILCCRT